MLTPVWQLVAPRLGVLEQPGPRRIHRVPTPTSGGLVLFVAAWGSLSLFSSAVSPVLPAGGAVLGALAFIVLLGFVDDLYDLKPSVKLLGQIVAALIFVGARVLVSPESLLFPPWPHSFGWGVLFALGWLVAWTNMYNIIDGLDGLAAGLATIAALPLLVLSAQHGVAFAAALAAAVIGAALGFLRYNANPARLFLGDAGGMFLGFALGVVSLEGVLGNGHGLAPALPLLAAGIPLLDTFSAVLRRWLAGRPIAKADAQHIHHQLLRNGMQTPRAVGLLYSIGAVLAAAAFAVARVHPMYSWIGLAAFGLVALPWARRLGVLGQPGQWRKRSGTDRRMEARIARLMPPEPVDFHEETGKFQGIAK